MLSSWVTIDFVLFCLPTHCPFCILSPLLLDPFLHPNGTTSIFVSYLFCYLWVYLNGVCVCVHEWVHMPWHACIGQILLSIVDFHLQPYLKENQNQPYSMQYELD